MGIRRDTVPAERWRADDAASGSALLSALEKRLAGVKAGNIMEVVAHDESAAAQIAAWCETTGNRLVWSQPPKFWIEHKR